MGNKDDRTLVPALKSILKTLACVKSNSPKPDNFTVPVGQSSSGQPGAGTAPLIARSTVHPSLLAGRSTGITDRGSDRSDSPSGMATIPAIPFSRGEPEYDYYVRLAQVIQNRSADQKPRILVITDIDQDYDDLLAIIFLAEMHRLGAVELAGCVTNHKPADARAKFLRTVLHLLGMPDVPVGIGTVGVEDENLASDLYYGLKNVTFANQEWNNRPFPRGTDLIEELALKTTKGGQGGNAAVPPLTVLLISTLQDISEFFKRHRNDEAFLTTKFKKFVSQGGHTIPDEKGQFTPCMNMANNSFHKEAATNYTNTIGRLGLRSDAWSREAAKAARMDGSFIQSLFKLGPIGAHLSWLWMRQEFKFFWDPLNMPFMPHLDVDWYLNTRLGLAPDSAEFRQLKESALTFSDVAPRIKVIAYDCCAAVGAVGDDFMRAMGVLKPEADMPPYNRAPKALHRVFGDSAADLGGIDADALARVMRVFLLGALKATAKAANLMIHASEVRHSTTQTPYKLSRFMEILPALKKFRGHEAMARKLEGDARSARDGGEAQRLMAEAGKERELAARAKADFHATTGIKEIPGPCDIPYEALYRDAMNQLEQRCVL